MRGERVLLAPHWRLTEINLQAPKPGITQSQMNYLLKMSRVLPPFLKDLDHSVQELRKSNTQAVMQCHCPLFCNAEEKEVYCQGDYFTLNVLRIAHLGAHQNLVES